MSKSYEKTAYEALKDPSLFTMTPLHENHLENLKGEVTSRLDSKYRTGQKEHGGRMWEKPGQLSCLEDELVDFISYFYTAKEQMQAQFPDAYEYLFASPVD